MEEIRTNKRNWFSQTVNINNTKIKFDEKGFSKVKNPEGFIKSFPESLFLSEDFKESKSKELTMEDKFKDIGELKDALKRKKVEEDRLKGKIKILEADVASWKEKVQELQRENAILNSCDDDKIVNAELNEVLSKKTMPKLIEALTDLRIEKLKEESKDFVRDDIAREVSKIIPKAKLIETILEESEE